MKKKSFFMNLVELLVVATKTASFSAAIARAPQRMK
jgi:hypothetical protein